MTVCEKILRRVTICAIKIRIKLANALGVGLVAGGHDSDSGITLPSAAHICTARMRGANDASTVAGAAPGAGGGIAEIHCARSEVDDATCEVSKEASVAAGAASMLVAPAAGASITSTNEPSAATVPETRMRAADALELRSSELPTAAAKR